LSHEIYTIDICKIESYKIFLRYMERNYIFEKHYNCVSVDWSDS